MFIIIALSEILSAQITFQKRYGWIGDDEGYSVQQSFDGGYISVGKSDNYTGYINIYLVKTNEYGDTLWTRTFNTGAGNTEGFSVEQTTDSGFIITGFTDFEIYLIRTDLNGDTLWTKVYIGFNDEVGYSIQQTFDGGFLIVGKTNTYGAGDDDVYLIKTNANGDSLWTKTYGGLSSDEGRYARQTADSGFIIVGSTNSFGNGANDIYIIRTNMNGDTLWTRAIGDSLKNYAYSVQQTLDGGFIICGNTGNISYSTYLLKIDSVGNISWSKTYSGSAYSVLQTADSGYVFAGSNGDALIVKTNLYGDTLWVRTFGELYGVRINFINLTSDRGFIMTGSKNVFDSMSYDVYLIKTDSNGYSSCSESNHSITVNAIPFQVVTPPTITSKGGQAFTFSTQTRINDNRGSYVIPLCNTVDVHQPISHSEFLVYPNPFHSKLTICSQKESVKDFFIVLQNMFGQSIFERKGKNLNSCFKETFDMSSLSPGMYLLNISIDGKRTSSRVVKD